MTSTPLGVNKDHETLRSDDNIPGASPSVEPIVTQTQKRQSSEKMKAIIAAELATESDFEENQKSVHFVSPIPDEEWAEMTRPLSVGLEVHEPTPNLKSKMEESNKKKRMTVKKAQLLRVCSGFIYSHLKI